MCTWVDKVKFACGCLVFDRRHRLFPIRCRRQHPTRRTCRKPPHGAGEPPIKIYSDFRCDAHYPSRRYGYRPFQNVPARCYRSVHAMAESGLFNQLLDRHFDASTFQTALCWEAGIFREG